MNLRDERPDGLDGLEGRCGSRRALLRGLAAVGVTTIGAGVLVACGAGSTGGAGATDADAGTTDASTTDASSGGGAAAEAAVPLAELPVGEARVVEALGARFVVARTGEQEVRAFSAACTHAGTPVEAAGGLALRCPAHGSRFDATDGSPTNGPATEPLREVGARVDGDQVVLTA